MIDEQIEYAGFWRRLGALFIDGIVMYPLAFANGWALKQSVLVIIVFSLVHNFIYWAYTLVLHKKYGATLGKWVLRIKVINADLSHNLSWRSILLRYIILILYGIFYFGITLLNLSSVSPEMRKTLSGEELMTHASLQNPYLGLLFITMFISIIWFVAEAIVMVWNYRYRAIHDYMAGTVVVKTESLPKIVTKNPFPDPQT